MSSLWSLVRLCGLRRPKQFGNTAFLIVCHIILIATYLWHLRSKEKAWRRLRVPAFHCGHGRSRVERIVQFHGIESGRVERKVLRGLHPLRIKATGPSCRCERRSPNTNVCHVPRFYTELGSG